MKTITQWIETFEEPYKSKAFKYRNESLLKVSSEEMTEAENELFSSPNIALMAAFTWHETYESFEYWSDYCHTLES